MARQPLPVPKTMTARGMIRLSLLFPSLLVGLFAAPTDDLVRAAETAETQLDSARALELFKQVDAAKPNDAFILQKIAKQYSDQVPEQKTDAAKREFATQALAYAQRSVDLEPTNAVYALSL